MNTHSTQQPNTTRLKKIPTGDQLDSMNMTEEQCTVGSHFSLGMNIRNDLGLWKYDSPLALGLYLMELDVRCKVLL